MAKHRSQATPVEQPAALARALDRASIDKQRVVLTRGGKPVAVLAPIEDMAALEALEDRIDTEEALARLAEWKAEGRPIVTLDEAMAEFGLTRVDLGK